MVFRVRGRVDLARMGERAPADHAPTAQGALRTLTFPGVTLQWRDDCVDAHVRTDAVALAMGRAREPARASASGEAAYWLDRYDRNGVRAPEQVGGGFAACIVDFARGIVVLFVDRFAIQSLCFRHASGIVAFSDSAAGAADDAPVDPQALYDYLYFHVIPAPRTVFQGVHRLQGAESVTIGKASVDLATYWQPRFVEDDRRGLRARMREFVEKVRASVQEEADDPRTACFLSGGTDSSTIAGTLKRLRDGPVAAYSIGFDAEGYDEMAYARIAARHFGLEHHEYYVTPDDVREAIPALAASFDQPFGNSSVLPAYFCALRAREDGFTRMLAGDGGDELYGGNSRYALQKVFDVYRVMPQRLRSKLLEPAAHNWRAFRTLPGLRQIGGYVRHASVRMPDRLDSFNLLRYVGDEQLLERQFIACIDPDAPLRQCRATWAATAACSLVNRMLAYDWKFTLADSDLPKVRAASQLAGVTTGYPLLSRAVTDLSLALPPEWKVRGVRLRWFFKRALSDFLPREILRKTKHGFGLPFGAWVLRDRALRDLAQDSVNGLARRGLVRPDFTARLFSDRLAEAPGYYGELVWILLMLEQWLRTHETTLALPPVGVPGGPVRIDAAGATIRSAA